MLNAIQGVKLYAHCNSWSEALCLLLYMKRSVMLIAMHGVKLYAQCYTRSEALCSLVQME